MSDLHGPLLGPADSAVNATADSQRRHTSLSQALMELEEVSRNHDTHESLDYDGVYNASFRDDAKKWHDHTTRRVWGYTGATLGRWVLTVVIGVVMGFIAFFLGTAIENLTLAKIGLVERILNPCAHPDTREQEGCDSDGFATKLSNGETLIAPWSALGVFCGLNAALALGGALPTVLLAPEAAGSGIPEVMGYLNGVHVQKIMRLRTLVVKVFATFMAVASGLAVGPEGPLVHTGAIVGSGVTRGFKVWRWGKKRVCSCRCAWLERFHNDTDRRDFISMGAAVGFAAAFGAPVGGVLFALEEAASFWNGKLMWRTLTATTCACFVMALSKKYIEAVVFGEHESCAFEDVQVCVTDLKIYNDTVCEPADSQASDTFQPGLLSFEGAKTFTNAWESFAAPIVIGTIGGMLGALFNWMHEKIGKLRKRHFRQTLPQSSRKLRMLLDVLMCSLITSVVMFSLSTWMGSCRYLNQSWETQNPSMVAGSCNVTDDDFRLQWGAPSPAPAPPPPPTCDKSCFRKKFPLIRKWGPFHSGLPAEKSGQFVCAVGGNVNSGNSCTPDRPYIGLSPDDAYGCSPDPKLFAESGDCCDTRQCDWVEKPNPPGFGHQCGTKEYNDMATALLVSREHVIVSIMVDPSRYSMSTLACVGGSFFLLMSLTYGSAIPAGVFIPTIMVGACFGGLAGRVMEVSLNDPHLAPHDEIHASPYALIGAVALLGGVQRSSLSLVVIILEGTGAMKQLLPIILTTVVSKWVGDAFNQGLYHTALELKHIPFLEPEVRRANRTKTAHDVMTPAGRRGEGVVTFGTKETVHSALNKLRDNNHNGFPVVKTLPDGRKAFVGLILRNQVYMVIAERHFVGGGPGAVGDGTAGVGGLESGMQQDLLDMLRQNAAADNQRTREKLYAAMVHRQDIDGEDVAGHRSKVPKLIGTIQEVVDEAFSREDDDQGGGGGGGGTVGDAVLNLKDVMNESPLTVDAHCPLPRVWTLFRTMGLRHLVVLDHDHAVVGVITRQDLLHAAETDGSPREGMASSRRVTGQRARKFQETVPEEDEEGNEGLLGSE